MNEVMHALSLWSEYVKLPWLVFVKQEVLSAHSVVCLILLLDAQSLPWTVLIALQFFLTVPPSLHQVPYSCQPIVIKTPTLT